MSGHLGGKPETSDDQHHTADPGADEPDDLDDPIGQAHRNIDEWFSTQVTPEAFEPWARRQIEKLWHGFRQHGDDIAGIQAHLTAWNFDDGGRDMRLTGGRIVEHAATQKWPIVQCGEPCGFVTTAATTDEVQELLGTHTCGHDDPELPPPAPPAPRGETVRTVINNLTGVIIVTLIMAFILALKGVIL